MLVINATGAAWPEARRRATLLHCLGAEGQRTFYSLLDTGDSFDSALAALEKHYTPKVNVVVERHAFRQRRQAPHETIAQYVAVVRDLASKCGFDDRANEMIRDQLVEHVANPNIRERLLLQLFSKPKQLQQTTVFQCKPYSHVLNSTKVNINSMLAQINPLLPLPNVPAAASGVVLINTWLTLLSAPQPKQLVNRVIKLDILLVFAARLNQVM